MDFDFQSVCDNKRVSCQMYVSRILRTTTALRLRYLLHFILVEKYFLQRRVCAGCDRTDHK